VMRCRCWHHHEGGHLVWLLVPNLGLAAADIIALWALVRQLYWERMF
jgi:hypothetical protein